MLEHIMGSIALTVAIFALNYIGVPGYVVALVIAFISSTSLLRVNQQGKIREKLAIMVSFFSGVIAYLLISGQSFGSYTGAVSFVFVGFGLTRLYKKQTDYHLWFMEVIPSVLRFIMFERVGGAVSGLGFTIQTPITNIPVRFIEAFLLVIIFSIFQGKIRKYLMLASAGAFGQREYFVSKYRWLKSFGKFIAVAAVVVIWFNPLNTLVVDNLKNNILDSLTDFGSSRSTITTISDSNGTNLLFVKSDLLVTDDQVALSILSSYDKELCGEYVFTQVSNLPTGNIIYDFAQVSSGIAILGSNKKLVVDSDKRPLYIVGTTRPGVENMPVPNNLINEHQAKELINDNLSASEYTVGNAVKSWNLAHNNLSSAYTLTYAVPTSIYYENDETVSFNVLVDAVTGKIYDMHDITFSNNSDLETIYSAIRAKGKFSNGEFENIVDSAESIIHGTDNNAWIYRKVLSEECIAYYTNKGDNRLGRSNANVINDAFEKAGIKDKNNDEGVVRVDMGTSHTTTVKGKINYPDNIDDIIITNNSMTTQRYTMKSDVPVTLSIIKTNGEVILTLPIFDEESFEIYPTGENEGYIITVRGGNSYPQSTGSVSASIIPTAYAAAQPLSAVGTWNNLYYDAEMASSASYELSIRQLEGNWNIDGADTVNAMLSKIMSSYNSSNGARYISLFRFDEFSNLAMEQYRQQLGTAGEPLIKMMEPFMSSQSMSIAAQSTLVTYRAANQLIKPMTIALTKSLTDATGQTITVSDQDIDKFVSDDLDKTAIAKTLFAVYSESGGWSSFRDSSGDKLPSELQNQFGALLSLLDANSEDNIKFNKLKGSKLSLIAIPNRSIYNNKSGKYFVYVKATIEKNGQIIFSDTLRLIIQAFGDAHGEVPAVGGDEGAWIANMLRNMSSTFTAGSYLAFDLSGVEYINVKSPLYFNWEGNLYDDKGSPANNSSITVQSNIDWSHVPISNLWSQNGNVLNFKLGDSHSGSEENITLYGEDEMGREVSTHLKIIQRDRYFDGGKLKLSNGEYEYYLTKNQAQSLLYDMKNTNYMAMALAGIYFPIEIIENPSFSNVVFAVWDEFFRTFTALDLIEAMYKDSIIDKEVKKLEKALDELKHINHGENGYGYIIVNPRKYLSDNYESHEGRIGPFGNEFTPDSLIKKEGRYEEPDSNASGMAIPSSENWLVNGVPQKFDTFLINDENYVKLRDVAAALNGTTRQFSIGMYANNRVPITSGLAYTRIGGELTGGSASEKKYEESKDKLVLNGNELNVTAYKIDDANYFRLRSLGDTLLFSIGYDHESKSVTITTPDEVSTTPVAPEVEYETTPRRGDRDGDGIPDDWEINGITIDGVFLPLNEWGCNPDVPDIFVEIDWMVRPGSPGLDSSSLQPSQRALKMVFDAFWRNGIQLHIDAGPDSINFVTGEKWGSQSGGNSLTYADNINANSYFNKVSTADFSRARRKIFHYAVFGNRYNGTDSSGFAWFPNDNEERGAMLFVSQGLIKDSGDTAVAGTFMHELGHNLNLRHGGSAAQNEINYKPNYLSIMNYAFQFRGLPGTNELNYSNCLLPTLDEKSLDERRGIDPLGITRNTGLGSWIEGTRCVVNNIASSPVDFDNNGTISDSPVRVDLNGGNGTRLEGFHDWNNIVFTSGIIGSGVGFDDEIEDNNEIGEFEPNELTIEEALKRGVLGYAGSGNVAAPFPIKIIEGVPNQKFFLRVINLSDEEATFKLYVNGEGICDEYNAHLIVDGSTTQLNYSVVALPLTNDPITGEYELVCRLVYPDRDDVVVRIPINVYAFTEDDWNTLQQEIDSGNLLGVVPDEVLNQLTSIVEDVADSKFTFVEHYGVIITVAIMVVLIGAVAVIVIIRKRRKKSKP